MEGSENEAEGGERFTIDNKSPFCCDRGVLKCDKKEEGRGLGGKASVSDIDER